MKLLAKMAPNPWQQLQLSDASLAAACKRSPSLDDAAAAAAFQFSASRSTHVRRFDHQDADYFFECQAHHQHSIQF